MLRCPEGSGEDELAELAGLAGGDERFAIEPLSHDGGASLALCGEIDNEALPALESALEVVAARRPCSVEVDLSGATFVSVDALKLLLRAAGHFRELVFYKSDSTTQRLVRLIGAEWALGCVRLRFEGSRNGQAPVASRYARTAGLPSARQDSRKGRRRTASGRQGATGGSHQADAPGRA